MACYHFIYCRWCVADLFYCLFGLLLLVEKFIEWMSKILFIRIQQPARKKIGLPGRSDDITNRMNKRDHGFQKIKFFPIMDNNRFDYFPEQVEIVCVCVVSKVWNWYVFAKVEYGDWWDASQGIVGYVGWGPRHGKSLYKPYKSGYLWVIMPQSQESLENTINTMGTLLGVHPSLSLESQEFWK